MNKAINLILAGAMLFTSCKGQIEQLKCFNESLQNVDLEPLVFKLKNELTDTLQNWLYNKKYENVQGLSDKIWRIDDALFLNPKRDKAILLLLEQDTTKYKTVPTGNGGAEKIKPTSFDLVKLVYANKDKNGWNFYYQSMELFVIPREKKNNGTLIPLTFEELSIKGRMNILMSYYQKGTCKYNEHFFENWDINSLKEKHNKINGY